MQTLKLFHPGEKSLIADYVDRMNDAMVRNNAATEVRAARMQAELSIQAHAAFLANMNHELRTPLNAIIGFATILHQENEYQLSDEKRQGYVEYILQSADLLLSHIDTLLEVAALESGEMEFHDQEIDLGEILDESIKRADVQAGAAEVSVARRDDGDLIKAWGDPERIGQAVDHLIKTAIKSCDKGGRLLVRATRDENGLPEIAIRDDGDGFTDDEIREALDAFNGDHRGLDRTFSGPGVGYAVAKTFIEMQQGKFSIKSRKGKGTLVRFTMPRHVEGARPVSQDDRATQKASPPTEIEMERTDDAA